MDACSLVKAHRAVVRDLVGCVGFVLLLLLGFVYLFVFCAYNFHIMHVGFKEVEAQHVTAEARASKS